jgi:uncharacterized protein YbaP (TraB family)
VRLYLLGSIHLAKEELYPLSSVIEDAFADSTGLVVEVDTEDLDEGAMALELMGKGVYADGRNLWDQLDQDTAERLRQALAGTVLNEALVAGMKPWLVGMTLEVQKLLDLGYKQELGLDRHFVRQARARNMPVGELESALEQLEVLTGFSQLDDGIKFLQVTLLEMAKIESEMDELFTAWTTGDFRGFEDIYFEAYRRHPEFIPVMERLITRRNETMVRRLEPFLGDPAARSFVIVGAAHLVGPKGVLASLEAMGYAVEQL